ncbi:hypothetical protein FOT62_13830 [Serratia marcescens]|uniref:Lipoprotein n=1 Tax=Serratia marcescens TaxID=615 RepID=A0A5C7CFK2_SERMA|nr:hypothetical protein [Serratia marcescens]TXE33246.1 hypothetical protein FOT62_13830 [Serratia marcescens]TXE65230.1 hypothetical protein FOT56_08545 [Serratia marcescens]
MRKHARLFIIALTALAVAALTACAAVSFTHANGAKGQSITNAEVQPNNTVVLQYPNGAACIDTNPGESTTCAGQGK